MVESGPNMKSGNPQIDLWALAESYSTGNVAGKFKFNLLILQRIKKTLLE
jgi:hypothetical protein